METLKSVVFFIQNEEFLALKNTSMAYFHILIQGAH